MDVDALRRKELTRLKMLVRLFREDLEDGEKVFVLLRKDAPLDEFEVLPVISLMRRYNPKAALLWVTVAGPDERHLVGQCEMVGNNLLKGYIDRFSGPNRIGAPFRLNAGKILWFPLCRRSADPFQLTLRVCRPNKSGLR